MSYKEVLRYGSLEQSLVCICFKHIAAPKRGAIPPAYAFFRAAIAGYAAGETRGQERNGIP